MLQRKNFQLLADSLRSKLAYLDCGCFRLSWELTDFCHFCWQHSMLFFFHHYELPVILSHQADPEEDLLADPIAALTDEVNMPAIDDIANHPALENNPHPDLPINDGKLI